MPAQRPSRSDALGTLPATPAQSLRPRPRFGTSLTRVCCSARVRQRRYTRRADVASVEISMRKSGARIRRTRQSAARPRCGRTRGALGPRQRRSVIWAFLLRTQLDTCCEWLPVTRGSGEDAPSLAFVLESPRLSAPGSRQVFREGLRGHGARPRPRQRWCSSFSLVGSRRGSRTRFEPPGGGSGAGRHDSVKRQLKPDQDLLPEPPLPAGRGRLGSSKPYRSPQTTADRKSSAAAEDA